MWQWAGQIALLPLKCSFGIKELLNIPLAVGRIDYIGGSTLGLKSSQKRERQNEKRRTRNRSYKSTARTTVKKAFEAIESGDLENAKQNTLEAVKALDKAAAKGAIHKNNASRRKSRLMTRLSALEKAA
jgi:small subunit ribosomal protein S20